MQDLHKELFLKQLSEKMVEKMEMTVENRQKKADRIENNSAKENLSIEEMFLRAKLNN